MRTKGAGRRFSVLKNLLNKSRKISLKERLASADRFLLHTIRLGNGRLKEMTYANGNIMRATYNGYGQLIAKNTFFRWFLTVHRLASQSFSSQSGAFAPDWFFYI